MKRNYREGGKKGREEKARKPKAEEGKRRRKKRGEEKRSGSPAKRRYGCNIKYQQYCLVASVLWHLKNKTRTPVSAASPPPPASPLPAPRPLQKACWNSKWLARVAPCVGNRRSLHTCASFQLERFYFSALVSRLLCPTREFASPRKKFPNPFIYSFIYLFISSFLSRKEEEEEEGNSNFSFLNFPNLCVVNLLN